MNEEVLQEAEAEELTLLVSDSQTGYFGVYLASPGRPKPYQARVKRGGNKVSLGMFATAEEAALCVARSPLCVARSPEEQAAAKRLAAAVPLTSEEARQQAQAEGLTLRVAENKAGYLCVNRNQSNKTKPYEAQVRRGGKKVYLGCFATAEEAALCVARSPEGQAAAGRAASADSQGSLPAVPSGAIPREKGTTSAMAPGAEPVVKVEALLLLLDDDLDLDECMGRHGRDNALLVSEEEGSDDRPKRQRKR